MKQKQASKQIRNAIIGLSLSALAHSISAQTLTTFTLNTGVTGVTTGTFDISSSSLSSTSDLTGSGNTYNYVSQLFTTSSGGTYTFGMSSASVDTLLILYSGSFNPASPGTNAVNLNDDFGSSGASLPPGVTQGSCGSPTYCPRMQQTLAASTTYYVVLSTYNAGDPLTSGPGLQFYVYGAPIGVGGAAPIVSVASGLFTPISNSPSLGAAGVLDTLNGGGGTSAAMQAAIDALAALSTSGQTAALNKLTPSPSRAMVVNSQGMVVAAMDRISARLDGLRVAGNDFSSASLASTGAVATGLSSGDAVTKYGFWTKAYAIENTQGEKDGFAGYKGRGWGMAMGADRDFGAGMVGGLALTYSRTGIDYRDQLDGNSAGVSSWQLSTYGTMPVGSAYLEGMVSYAVQRYESKRDTVVNGYAHGNYRGDQWGARLGLGRAYALSEQTSITPQVRLDWSSTAQNSYTESDAGVLSLDVSGTRADRLRGSIGAQLNHDTTWGNTPVRPFVRAFYNVDFQNDGVDSTASFLGGGTNFRTTGQQLDRDTYNVGLGVVMFSKDGFSATVSYDQDIGSKYRAHTAQAQARWMF